LFANELTTGLQAQQVAAGNIHSIKLPAIVALEILFLQLLKVLINIQVVVST
jgi:hypothetical protein